MCVCVATSCDCSGHVMLFWSLSGGCSSSPVLRWRLWTLSPGEEPCEAVWNFSCSHGRRCGKRKQARKKMLPSLPWQLWRMNQQMNWRGFSPCVSPVNQPDSKVCMHAYLFPFPISHRTHNSTEYDSAISKRLSLSPPPSSGVTGVWPPPPLLCSLQGLLERLHADRRGGRGARRLHHHLRRTVCQPPPVQSRRRPLPGIRWVRFLSWRVTVKGPWASVEVRVNCECFFLGGGSHNDLDCLRWNRRLHIFWSHDTEQYKSGMKSGKYCFVRRAWFQDGLRIKIII